MAIETINELQERGVVERLIEPDIGAGRLHHRGLVGVEGDPPGLHLHADVAVGGQHRLTLARPSRCAAEC